MGGGGGGPDPQDPPLDPPLHTRVMDEACVGHN